MTRSQKELIKKLLTGHFMRRMKSRLGSWYVLYDSKINPLMKIHERTVASIDRFIDPKIKIWKKSKRGDITLNLSMVRRLNGNTTINKMYKGKLTRVAGTIYKQRNKKKKLNTEQNEKVRYLF